MCTQRTWKDLLPTISDNNISILATRSDGLMVRVRANHKSTLEEVLLVKKVKRMMDDLNSFRNCSCSINAPCPKHARNELREKKKKAIK